MNVIIHTDGGARGNPGPAAIGVVIEDGDNSLHTHRADADGTTRVISAFGKRIGETTNNVAEYTAVIEALKAVNNLSNITRIDFYLDSMLVVNQLNGLFKIKDSRLRELCMKIRELEGETGASIAYHAVPRELNRKADALVNRAFDK